MITIVADGPHIAQLPASIGQLHNLATMELCNCYALTALPDSIGILTALTVLKVHQCPKLSRLPETIGGLESLEELSLVDCLVLSELPESIGDLKALIHLNLGGCGGMPRVPDTVGQMVSLKSLDVAGMLRPTANTDNTNSRVLRSTSRALFRFPRAMGPASLQCLYIHGCIISQQLPCDLSYIKSIVTLHIGRLWHIRTLPRIDTLCALTSLIVRDCPMLQVIPSPPKSLLKIAMSDLDRLETIDLDQSNSISHIDIDNLTIIDTLLRASIIRLRDLEVLDIVNCKQCHRIPNALGQLENATHVHLTKCLNLTWLPETIGNLKHLKTLKIVECGIFNLPASIGQLVSLERLVIVNCRNIKVLPTSIGYLKALHTLNLDRCKSLTTLPETITRLPLLSCLRLRECTSLSRLPEYIGNVSTLQTLHLAWCKSLTQLPASMGCLPHIRISRVYCSGLPYWICRQPWALVCDRLLNRYSPIKIMGLIVAMRHYSVSTSLPTELWSMVLAQCARLHEQAKDDTSSDRNITVSDTTDSDTTDSD